MVLQDALITLPHERYGEYLEIVYRKMATHIDEPAFVVEIGARHDRGVLSRSIIPHWRFVAVDKNRCRGDLAIDVLAEKVAADVIVSTCILHHTAKADIPRLLDNLDAPLLMFSGPTIEQNPELYGDHQWHIETGWLRDELELRGYETDAQPIGMSQPFSEVLIVAQQ